MLFGTDTLRPWTCLQCALNTTCNCVRPNAHTVLVSGRLGYYDTGDVSIKRQIANGALINVFHQCFVWLYRNLKMKVRKIEPCNFVNIALYAHVCVPCAGRSPVCKMTLNYVFVHKMCIQYIRCNKHAPGPYCATNSVTLFGTVTVACPLFFWKDTLIANYVGRETLTHNTKHSCFGQTL